MPLRILIVKIGAIGDVVLTLPLLKHIKTLHPDAEITWVVGKLPSPIVEATGLVRHVIAVDEKALLKPPVFRQIWEMLKLWSRLKRLSTDFILTAHPDPRYRWISLFCRSKVHRHWERNGARRFPVPGRYHAEEYIRLFTPQEGPFPFAAEFPPLQLPKINAPSNCIVLAPGGAKNILSDLDSGLRRWPIENYRAVMSALSKYSLAVIGAKSDEWVRPHLEGVQYADFIGKLNLLETIALLKQSRLFLSHDSGPLHLAKLAQCQTIGLFGPTNPSELVGPNEKIDVIWGGAHLGCRPCYDGKTFAKCSRNLCLQSISVEHVLEAMAKRL